jgi:hypothetical protein
VALLSIICLVGTAFSVFSLIGVENLVIYVVVLGYALVSLIAAIELLRLHNMGRILALILLGIDILIAGVHMLTPANMGSMLVALAVDILFLWYLAREDVRERFH